MKTTTDDQMYRYMDAIDRRLCECQQAISSAVTLIESIERRILEFYIPLQSFEEVEDFENEDNDVEET